MMAEKARGRRGGCRDNLDNRGVGERDARLAEGLEEEAELQRVPTRIRLHTPAWFNTFALGRSAPQPLNAMARVI